MKRTLLLAGLLALATPVASAMGGQSLDIGYDNNKLTGGGKDDITFSGLRASYDLPLAPVAQDIYVSLNASAYYGWASDDVDSPLTGKPADASQAFYGGDISFVGNMALSGNIMLYTGACYSIGTFKSDFDDKGLKGHDMSESLHGYGFLVGVRFYIGQNLHINVGYRQMEYKKKNDWEPKGKSFNVGLGITF